MSTTITIPSQRIMEYNLKRLRTTQRLTTQAPALSKRRTKNIVSRTQSRKQANARAALQRVGGYSSDARAIYAPPNTALCRVVYAQDMGAHLARATLNVGGSTPQPQLGGR